MPQSDSQAITDGGPVWAAKAFLLSLLVPIYLPIGNLLLMPHRIVLLVLFVPFFLRLFIRGRAGPVLVADWLLFCSALWAALALFVNHGATSMAIEGAGIHMIEFFGAYLIARVAIRNGEDFRRVVRMLFLIVAFLLPFAAAESITKRPVMLDLLPFSSVGVTDMGFRWGMRRAQTIFAHPILFGAFVSAGLGVFWYALRPRGLRFIAAPLAAVATVFSLSTGALIAIVVQVIFISWETILRTLRARWRLFAALSVAAYIFIDLLSNRTPFHVLVTYGTFSTGSAYNRIHIWNYGTDNVADNPIFGLGFNDWIRPPWMSPSVDNFWLLLTMRYGIPMFIMAAVALIIILRRVSRAELMNSDDRLARAGYLVSFGGLAIAGGTVHYWHAMMAFALFMFGSGVWAATGGGRREEDTATSEPEPLPVSRYTRQTMRDRPIGRAPRPVSVSHETPVSPYRREPTGRSEPRRAP